MNIYEVSYIIYESSCVCIASAPINVILSFIESILFIYLKYFYTLTFKFS